MLKVPEQRFLAAPGDCGKTDVLLKPMEGITKDQIFTLQPVEDPVGVGNDRVKYS